MGTRDTRDIIGGVLLTITGIYFALHSGNYNMGEAARMGPGYFPTVLGWILAAMGLLIAAMALRRSGEVIDFQLAPCAPRGS